MYEAECLSINIYHLGSLVILVSTHPVLSSTSIPRRHDQITKILSLDILEGQMMPSFEIHDEGYIALTQFGQRLTPGFDVIVPPPRMDRRHLLEQLVVGGVDTIREPDRRVRATDHDPKRKLGRGLVLAQVAFLDLLPQQQPGREPRALAEPDDALEGVHAAVGVHGVENDGVDGVDFVLRGRFDVAFTGLEASVDPAVKGRAGCKDGQHAVAGGSFDRGLDEDEPELFLECPDQSTRLDLEDGRVGAAAV